MHFLLLLLTRALATEMIVLALLLTVVCRPIALLSTWRAALAQAAAAVAIEVVQMLVEVLFMALIPTVTAVVIATAATAAVRRNGAIRPHPRRFAEF